MEQLMDLHVHSQHSDGILTPSELVRRASSKGVKVIALADHDNLDGIDEALREGKLVGVDVVPAVELSVTYKIFDDVHLLGYYINHHDETFERILANYRSERNTRNAKMIEKINIRLSVHGKGHITISEVESLAAGAIGRPHIARILVEKGFAHDIQDAFEKYLIPCNVTKKYFPMEEAINEIKRIGGVAVLAHPQSITQDRKTLAALVADLALIGLDGLEVFNNMCYKDDIFFLENLARSLNLIMTGGSDFHGFEEGVEIGTGRGGLSIPCSLLDPLKLKASQPSAPA